MRPRHTVVDHRVAEPRGPREASRGDQAFRHVRGKIRVRNWAAPCTVLAAVDNLRPWEPTICGGDRGRRCHDPATHATAVVVAELVGAAASDYPVGSSIAIRRSATNYGRPKCPVHNDAGRGWTDLFTTGHYWRRWIVDNANVTRLVVTLNPI